MMETIRIMAMKQNNLMNFDLEILKEQNYSIHRCFRIGQKLDRF